MIKNILCPLIVLITIITSCNNSAPETSPVNNSTDSFRLGSFGYNLHFLKQQDDSVVVLSDGSGKAQLIVSPKKNPDFVINY
ncbi:MAG: hypothetical protein ABI594_03455 [Ginsengibacter sp.]